MVGDYNGDGKDDAGFLYCPTDNSAIFMIAPGSSSGVAGPAGVWSVPASSWEKNRMKVS